MKKIATLVLSLCLLFSLASCAYNSSGMIEPAEFFYQRKISDIKEHPTDGVIASELREASGHRNDWNYLLSLYLRGPLDRSLVSPFPASCKLIGISREEKTLHIILDENFAELKDIDLTIACACLAKTCISLANVEAVHIEAASADGTNLINLIIDRGSLLLEENGIIPQETEPTT